MSFWSSTTVKKTRKEHRCEYCNVVIPRGSSCRNESGMYEGDFNYYYLCNRCVLFLDMFVDLADRDWLGEFAEDLRELDMLNCPRCKRWHKRNSEFADDMQSVSLECNECDHIWTMDISLEALLVIHEVLKGKEND